MSVFIVFAERSWRLLELPSLCLEALRLLPWSRNVSFVSIGLVLGSSVLVLRPGVLVSILKACTWSHHWHYFSKNTHNRFTALWNLSGTTRVSRYQKKHSPTHTHRHHQSSQSTFSSKNCNHIYFDNHTWVWFCRTIAILNLGHYE